MSEYLDPRDERLPKLPRHTEWKSWYLSKALGPLMLKTDSPPEGIEKMLRYLEQDPSCQEAAVALFWSVYLADRKPEQLTEERVKRIMSISTKIREDERVGERLAFAKLHLAGMVVALLRRSEVERNGIECDNAAEACEIAAVAKSRFRNIKSIKGANESFWGRDQVSALSLSRVIGITDLLLALQREGEGRYEESFRLVYEASEELCSTRFSTFDPSESVSEQEHDFQPGAFRLRRVVIQPIPVDFEFLPFLHEWQDNLSIDDNFVDDHLWLVDQAARVFDGVCSDPGAVKDWETVMQACEYFRDLDYSCEDGYYADEGYEVKDSDDRYWKPEEYWGKAVTFCNKEREVCRWRGSLQSIREDEAVRAEDRLRQDFLYDIWEDLPEQAQDNLVVAETRWAMRDSLKYKDMMDAYRLALEAILDNVFPDIADKARREINQLKKDRKKTPGLLSEIGKLLHDNPEVRKQIEGRLSPEDAEFVLDNLPDLLWSVAKSRNVPSHSNERLTPMTTEDKAEGIKRAEEARRKLLGIRHERAVIQRLVEIKKAMKQGTEHGQSG